MDIIALRNYIGGLSKKAFSQEVIFIIKAYLKMVMSLSK